MGKIIVGKEKAREFESLTGYEGRKAPSKKGMTIGEQRVMAEKLIKGLPEEKWVGTLLAHGLKDVADEVNRSLVEKARYEAELRERRQAEEAARLEREAAEQAERERQERLAEIMLLPEDERLVALVEEGFEEEAKALVGARNAASDGSERKSADGPEGEGESEESEDGGAESGDEDAGQSDGEGSAGEGTDSGVPAEKHAKKPARKSAPKAASDEE